MPNKGRDKGLRYERLFPKILSKWWSKGEDIFIFSSTHGSGNKGNPEVIEEFGDVMSVKASGYAFTKKYRIELKHYETIDPWKLITGKKCEIYEWWKDYSLDMEKNKDNRELIIFLRIDYKGDFVIISKQSLSWLEKLVGDFNKEKILFWNDLTIFPFKYWEEMICKDIFLI